jgi:hypothetical protein
MKPDYRLLTTDAAGAAGVTTGINGVAADATTPASAVTTGTAGQVSSRKAQASLDAAAAISPSTVGTHAHPTAAQLSGDKVAAGQASQSALDAGYLQATVDVVLVVTSLGAVAGNYKPYGFFNGKIYFKHTTASFYIWWETGSWYCGTAVQNYDDPTNWSSETLLSAQWSHNPLGGEEEMATAFTI